MPGLTILVIISQLLSASLRRTLSLSRGNSESKVGFIKEKPKIFIISDTELYNYLKINRRCTVKIYFEPKPFESIMVQKNYEYFQKKLEERFDLELKNYQFDRSNGVIFSLEENNASLFFANNTILIIQISDKAIFVYKYEILISSLEILIFEKDSYYK